MICDFCGKIVKAVMAVNVSKRKRVVDCACAICYDKGRKILSHAKMQMRLRKRNPTQKALERSIVRKQGTLYEVALKANRTRNL